MKALSKYVCEEIGKELICQRHYPDWIFWTTISLSGLMLIVLIILGVYLIREW